MWLVTREGATIQNSTPALNKATLGEQWCLHTEYSTWSGVPSPVGRRSNRDRVLRFDTTVHLCPKSEDYGDPYEDGACKNQMRCRGPSFRFLVVKLIYLILNFRFDLCIIFMINYFLVGGDISVNSEIFLLIDFINLKIKANSVAHIDKTCICVYNNKYSYIYIWIFIFVLYILKKNEIRRLRIRSSSRSLNRVV
jgi:hypothetical protein